MIWKSQATPPAAAYPAIYGSEVWNLDHNDPLRGQNSPRFMEKFNRIQNVFEDRDQRHGMKESRRLLA